MTKAKTMDELLAKYFDHVTDPEQQDALRALPSDSHTEFMKLANSFVNNQPTLNGCPRDWTQCDNGTCVPPGESCENEA